MKNERDRTRELNTLSAYLDDALTADERQMFEARLAGDTELRERLENLRTTKLLVGRLPRLHAPRNFTLTPDMVTVRRPKRQPLFNYVRLASALAAILLVVLFSADILINGDLGARPQSAEEFVMEAATMADEATPEPLILWAEPGVGGAGEGRIDGMREESSALEEPMLEMESAPSEEEEETESELAPADEAEAFSAEAPAGKDADIILGVRPDKAGEIINRSEPGSQSEPELAFPWSDVLHWTQIALAAIAVGGGITLLVLKSKRLS